MRILMLGWEYPPLITGGLATATEGIINGLIALGHEILLVLPYFPFKIEKQGLSIISPEQPHAAIAGGTLSSWSNVTNNSILEKIMSEESRNLVEIANGLQEMTKWPSHYDIGYHFDGSGPLTDEQRGFIKEKLLQRDNEIKAAITRGEIPPPMFDSMDEKMYAIGLLACAALENNTIDVVHAHDWMSFIGIEMVKQHGFKHPTVVHVHSTEYDRAGYAGNQWIIDIEKRGMEAADLVVCVSQYTRTVVMRNFGINPGKIDVAYNAANEQHDNNGKDEPKFKRAEDTPVVTFVGRITYQKGPAYFVQAANMVLKTNPNVKFRVVGTGDLLPSMKQYVWELGIDKSFIFDGFLNSKQVQEVLCESDIFVMPSVSEPFGIVALEAVQQNIPVIISKQSGVSEVLPNALKVDFWDTELLADRILSLLKYPRAKTELIKNAARDLGCRTWMQTAKKLEEVYLRVTDV